MILNFSDSFFFIFYLVLNNYVYPSGGFTWCTLPKVGCIVALYYYYMDRKKDLAMTFLISCFQNLIHVVMCEEIMLSIHRGLKGRSVVTGKNVEAPEAKKVAEIRPLRKQAVCKFTTIEFYVAINLDLGYILKMGKVNIIETLEWIVCLFTKRKPEEKAKEAKYD